MQIFRDGAIAYDSIDNTGSTDEAALGARYAKGRIDTIANDLETNYYTKRQVVEMFAGVSDTYVVSELPADPEDNTYYLVGDDEVGYVLYFFDSEGNRAQVGNYDTLSDKATVVTCAELPNEPVENTIYVVGDGEAEVYLFAGDLHRLGGLDEAVYADVVGKPTVDGNVVQVANTHESLGLIGVADFVTAPTGKSDGLEIVVSDVAGDAAVSTSEIDDSDGMRYSTVHTSSNNAINRKFDAVNNALATRLNYEFVDEMPEEPAANTQYYAATDDPAVRQIYIVDKLGETHDMGTSNITLDGLVNETRTIAGLPLDADITATQVADATKEESVILKNKSISAADNTLSDVETGVLKEGVLQTAMPETPTDEMLVTAKLVDSLTKLNVVTGADALTLTKNSILTATSFNSYAPTQILKVGKLCVFSSHVTFTKTSTNAQWITVGTLASGYRPKRNTVFAGSLWDTGTTFGIGGHVKTDGSVAWWCDGNGRSAINNGQLRFVCVYECE